MVMGVVFEEMAYENKLKVVLHFWRSSYRASMTKLPTHMGWSVIFVVSEIGSLHIRAFEARAKGFWFIFVSASLSHIKLAVSCSFLERIKPNRHVFFIDFVRFDSKFWCFFFPLFVFSHI